MARPHKHNWKRDSVTVGDTVSVTWSCQVRGCFGTRTVPLKLRKPRPDALTDQDRAERYEQRRQKRLTPYTPKGEDPAEDFVEDLLKEGEARRRRGRGSR